MTEVTQDDRDAACGLTGGHYWNEVKRGKRDGDQLVQAFTRHRVAERLAERAAIVAWLRETWNGRLQSSIFLADSIEAGEHLK